MKLHQIKHPYCGNYLTFIQITSLKLGVMLIAASMLLPIQAVRAEGVQGIEEIVVTARKRQESLQEVPVVVTVLTEDVINSQRIEGIKDVGTIVPGMLTSQTISGTSGIIYLRGVGTGAANPAFDQAVSINLDGIGISSAQLMNAGMFDLRQIEVLRGPQALFYGKNSPGGVIAIHTNDPTDEFELELSAAYETEAEEPTIRGIISGPLSDTLGGRISFGWSKSGKTLVDVINSDQFEPGPAGPVQTAFATGDSEIETSYAMGTLLWQPTNNFSAKLKYAQLEDELVGVPYAGIQKSWCGLGVPQEIYPVAGYNNCKADDSAAIGGANPALLGALQNGRFAGHGPDEQFIRHDNDFAALEMNYETQGGLTLTSVTGYLGNDELRLADAAFQVASGLSVTNGTKLEQWSQELRLVSDLNAAVNFTLGAFYETKEIDRDTDVALASNFAGLPIAAFGVFPIPLGRQISGQEGTSYSVFGQIEWDINQQFTLAVGGRLSYEEKEASINAIAGGFDVNVPFLNDEQDWDNFSPDVTLRYQYNEDVMFFASYRTGFKSGGFDLSYKPSLHVPLSLTPGATFDGIYNEETVDGFEVGMKSTLLEGALRLNVTAYSFAYEDLQLSIFDGPTLSFQVRNAAKASLDGLEIESVWVTQVEGLTLSANVAWANSEFDSHIADCFTGQTIALGCNARPHPVTGNFTGTDVSGNSLPYASDLSANLGVSYETQVSGNWMLGFNLTGSFKDDYSPVAEVVPDEAQQDGYWWVNAAVNLYSTDEKWEFFVRGVNLADEYYRMSATGSPLTGNAATTGTADPSGLPDLIAYVSGGTQITLGLTYRM